jgi:TatD DNase family protein
MAADAHAHPYYLQLKDKDGERERELLGIACAASSCGPDEFIFNEAAAARRGAPFMAPCFAVHPQLPATTDADADGLCSFLETLAGEKRIAAVGEVGFDLFNAAYRATEKTQDAIFEHHLEVALRHSLPMALHVRCAMHKIFERTHALKRVRALVFHSYSGSLDEARSVLRRGMNGYFSFGTAIMKGHKNAMRCAAALDGERLLFETDAPYQPPRGKEFSTWSDIFSVINAAANLRRQAGSATSDKDALEAVTDANFDAVFRDA